MLEIGSVIDGKYKILNKIGQGGMSVVYLAMNERANKQWAIKEVRKDGVQNYEVVKQGLVAETDILKRLNHPHLPSIIDVIDGEDTFLIVMDYIEGRPLSKELDEQGAQPQERVIDWAIQLCDVLGYLHSRKPPIIYRDLKPSNVMRKPDGNLMLIDFGTAREFKGGDRVQDTTCLGTIGYAAPEQFGGHGETDARTDIFNLGATLYHLVTGHNPGEPPYKMYPIRYWNPSLSSGLEEIILKCTQPNPIDRYQSCAELMYDLEHYQDKDHTYRKGLKHRIQGFIAAAAACVFCGVGALGFHAAAIGEQRDTYEYYLNRAEVGKDSSEKEQNYLSAIETDPTQVDACLGLLNDAYLADDTFEYSTPSDASSSYMTEAQKMDEIINGFEGSDYDLAEIRYRVGIATYYYADGIGNKQGSYKYFADVVGDDGEGAFDPGEPDAAQKLQRAACLKNIADYYGKLYTQDRSGDNTASFDIYWQDMREAIRGNIVEQDNYKTALVVYKEFVTTIRDKIGDFQKAGVTEGDVQAQLENVTQHLDEDFTALLEGESSANAATKEEISETMEEIRAIIEQAQRQVGLAYSR